jgi:hypothetical protein
MTSIIYNPDCDILLPIKDNRQHLGLINSIGKLREVTVSDQCGPPNCIVDGGNVHIFAEWPLTQWNVECYLNNIGEALYYPSIHLFCIFYTYLSDPLIPAEEISSTFREQLSTPHCMFTLGFIVPQD